MKRSYALLVLSLVVLQLFLLPVVANAFFSGSLITTLPATDVAQTTATLNAAVAPRMTGTSNSSGVIYVNDPTPTCHGYFKYGTTSGMYTDQTPSVTLSFQAGGFHANLTGLKPCTTYYAQAFLSCPEAEGYEHGPTANLIALLQGDSNMRGLGVGLSPRGINGALSIPVNQVAHGAEISFKTSGCQLAPTPHGAGGMAATAPRPFVMSNITVKTAALSSSKVAPGEQVAITANMVNQGGSNGDAKVTLYVNGQEVESKAITLTSGENAQMHFSVSRNEPGTYSVYVGGVSAGAFTVDPFNNNDILIYASIALLTLGIGGVLYMTTRRRTA
jgi:hypothetical protein